jgi:hypothetical protein
MSPSLKLEMENSGAIEFYLNLLFKEDPIAYKLVKKYLKISDISKLEIEYKVLNNEVIRKIKIYDGLSLLVW